MRGKLKTVFVHQTGGFALLPEAERVVIRGMTHSRILLPYLAS